MDIFVLKILFMEDWRLALASVLPCRNIGVLVIVTQGFAFFCLVLLTEMTTAGFLAMQSVNTHEFAQLQEILDAISRLKRLIHASTRARHTQVRLELFTQITNHVNCLAQALRRTRHTAVLPHDSAKRPVEILR